MRLENKMGEKYREVSRLTKLQKNVKINQKKIRKQDPAIRKMQGQGTPLEALETYKQTHSIVCQAKIY